MKKYDKENPLISIHIPKCGGSSFIEVLQKWFNGKFYSHYFNEKDNQMSPNYDLKPGICIHGHFNKKRLFGIKDYYPEADQFITILRDPFEIVVSRYFFVKRAEHAKKEGPFYFAGNPLRLEDDVNSYLKNVVSDPDYHPNLLDYMPYEMTMGNCQEILEKHFVYIGITEDIQTSVNMLASKLGFPQVEIDHQNISERYQEIEEGLKEEFIKKHPLEYAIYNYALKNYRR